MLALEDIYVSYGEAKALFGVSLEINRGKVVGVIGANGAGKTTTLKTIAGFMSCSSGKVLFENQDINQWSPSQRVQQGIALVLEGRQVFAGMTVRENLLAGAYLRKDRLEIKRDYEFIMDLFPRLKEREKQQTGLMSGGEQQMCAIGRGLMTRPKILMIDELSLGLAPVAIDRLAESIRRLHEESDITILFVEQDVYLAMDLCEYCYVLDHGRVVKHGLTADLSKDEDLVKSYLGK